jgi:hypothetical protein
MRPHINEITVAQWLAEFTIENGEEITHVRIEDTTFAVSDLPSEILNKRFYSNGDETDIDMAWSLNYVINIVQEDFQDYPSDHVIPRNPL